jgi:hypothetical protein
MQLTHNRRPGAFPICIQAAFVCSLLLATPADVDVESQQYIEYTLANPQMLHDTSVTWRNVDRWLFRVGGQPWLAEAMYAELGFTDEEMLLFEQVVQARKRVERAQGQKDGVYYGAVNHGREMDDHERAEFSALERQVACFRDSLEHAKQRLARKLTPAKSERFNRWLRETDFLGAVTGAKVDQAFYGLVSYGPGYFSAPDSLESAWRLLEGSLSFQALVDETAEQAYRTLPGARRLTYSDSVAVMDTLRDYRRRVFRSRAGLIFADRAAYRLSPLESGTSEELVDAYTRELVGRIRTLKRRTTEAAAQAVGKSAEELGEIWVP